jgi:hypothetical protein
MGYESVDFEFDKEFDTWIIAYCPDIDLWFTTKQRAFYYEYNKEFVIEREAVDYFAAHAKEFVELNNDMSCWRGCAEWVWLETTKGDFVKINKETMDIEHQKKRSCNII